MHNKMDASSDGYLFERNGAGDLLFLTGQTEVPSPPSLFRDAALHNLGEF